MVQISAFFSALCLQSIIYVAIADAASHLLSVEFASGGGTVSYGVSVADELFFASSRPLVFVNCHIAGSRQRSKVLPFQGQGEIQLGLIRPQRSRCWWKRLARQSRLRRDPIQRKMRLCFPQLSRWAQTGPTARRLDTTHARL